MVFKSRGFGRCSAFRTRSSGNNAARPGLVTKGWETTTCERAWHFAWTYAARLQCQESTCLLGLLLFTQAKLIGHGCAYGKSMTSKCGQGRFQCFLAKMTQGGSRPLAAEQAPQLLPAPHLERGWMGEHSQLCVDHLHDSLYDSGNRLRARSQQVFMQGMG